MASGHAKAVQPSTDLAAQLQQLAVRQHVDQGRRHLGKASLLYTFQEAADIDGETIYRIGLEGECLRVRPRPGSARHATCAAAAAAAAAIARCVARAPAWALHCAASTASCRHTCLDSAPPLAPGAAPRRAAAPVAPPSPPAAACRPLLSASPAAGLDQLCALDGRFQAYRRTLFGQASQALDRDAATQEVNARLDAAVAGFCALLSSYFLLAPAFKALEFLVRQYK